MAKIKIAKKLTTWSVGGNNPTTQSLSAEVEYKLRETFESSWVISMELEHRQFYFWAHTQQKWVNYELKDMYKNVLAALFVGVPNWKQVSYHSRVDK